MSDIQLLIAAAAAALERQISRLFCHNFIDYLASLEASKFIHLPTTDDELKHVSDFYSKLGLPGCAGSADCVYLFWDKECPTPLVSQCRGKEKLPSVVFQVVVSHTKRILSISQIHMGCNKINKLQGMIQQLAAFEQARTL
jgi:hypothetical protein